jgi:hypothetical protein
MARKLKTFQTSLGVYDLAIAAPSMKVALEDWGAKSNLFHQVPRRLRGRRGDDVEARRRPNATCRIRQPLQGTCRAAYDSPMTMRATLMMVGRLSTAAAPDRDEAQARPWDHRRLRPRFGRSPYWGPPPSEPPRGTKVEVDRAFDDAGLARDVVEFGRSEAVIGKDAQGRGRDFGGPCILSPATLARSIIPGSRFT